MSASLRNQGAMYSIPGIARISRDRLGVPPCQQRASRMIAEPAGSGHTVLRRIHSGSSASVGIGARERWVPGMNRVGPLIGVRSVVGHRHAASDLYRSSRPSATADSSPRPSA